MDERTYNTPAPAETISNVIELVAEVVRGWDYDLPEDTGAETRLVADLGFQSVDLVMLLVSIEARYQVTGLPFERLVMIDGRYVKDLTIGALSTFLLEEFDRAARHRTSGARSTPAQGA